MKVLLLADSLSAGGAERQFSLLCRSLQQRGIVVKVHSLDNGLFARELRDFSIDLTVTERKGRYDTRPIQRISHIISDFRPDVVHSWGWMSTFSAHLHCKLKRIPLIGSVRCAFVSKKKKIRDLLEKRLCDLVISNSLAGLEAYRVSSRKGRVVYNGFEIERVPSAECERYPDTVVIMVARMGPEKDWKCFADAIHLLQRRSGMEGVRYIGIGDGPDRNRITEYCKDLLQAGILSLPGFLDEPIKEVCKSHVGVLATTHGVQEGTSNSILEYMACKLPVVCSRSGGNLETVDESETGLLVTPGNAQELADAVERLCLDRNLAESMGKKGRQKLEDNYTVEKMTDDTIGVYSELL
jgi:glycosyltransferase involved in cell wall biosynthesis